MWKKRRKTAAAMARMVARILPAYTGFDALDIYGVASELEKEATSSPIFLAAKMEVRRKRKEAEEAGYR